MSAYVPGCSSVRTPSSWSKSCVPVPPPETIRGARLSARRRSTSTHERLEQLTGARAPEVVGDGVLMVADVALDTRVLEAGGVGDLVARAPRCGPRRRGRCGARRPRCPPGPGAGVPSVPPAASSWATLAGSSATTIRPSARALRAARRSSFGLGDDGGEEHDSRYSGLDHGLALRKRGAAHADAAGGDLPARDVRRLVHLRDRPHVVPVHPRVLGERRDVRIQHVEVEDERRRPELEISIPAGRSELHWDHGSTAPA